jgi:hypothetical protein
MVDSPAMTNTVSSTPEKPGRPGDVPETIRRRYLTERRLDGAVVYFQDATVVSPSFRDTGRRLIAARSDPATIRDLLLVAQHRGWSAVHVRGEEGFRREAWMAGRALGLEVEGYRPTERDEQALAKRRDGQRAATRPDRARSDPRASTLDLRSPGDRLKVVEAVVRSRNADPTVQSQILAAARQRVAELQRQRDREPWAGRRDR